MTIIKGQLIKYQKKEHFDETKNFVLLHPNERVKKEPIKTIDFYLWKKKIKFLKLPL